MRLLLVACALFAVWQLCSISESVTLADGIQIEHPPIQTSIKQPSPFKYKAYQITPLAEFKVSAKVLARENYYFDRESDLSPMDFVLGWQAMSDQAIVDRISMTQSGRWYHWSVKTFPIPRRDIESQSANMHLIPSDDVIEKGLNDVKQGQIINLKGMLVRVDGQDGWHWQSSLTRDDVGNHACELFYVTEIELEQ